MYAATVAGVVERRRGRVWPGKRPVVAHIGPEPAGDGLAFGQHGDGGAVAAQPLGGEHVLRDQSVERRWRCRGGADTIGPVGSADITPWDRAKPDGGDIKIDAFLGMALALAVERLVLAVLLEQDHRQEAGADPVTTPSAGDGRMKRPRSNFFENGHIPWLSCQRIFNRSPLRPRNTKTCPPNGSRRSTSCTRKAKPCIPRRLSVWPVASRIRVAEGSGITARGSHAACRVGWAAGETSSGTLRPP